MRADERAEFEAVIATIFAAFDKPFADEARETFWQGLNRLSLIEVCRVRDLLLRELEHEEPPRKFGLRHFWAARRRLRAAAPVVTPEANWQGDDWDIEANWRLLRYLTERAPHSFGRAPSYAAMQRSRDANADASPQFVAAVRVLIAYKSAWARDMRESENPDGKHRNECWQDCMRRAEAEIAALMKAAA